MNIFKTSFLLNKRFLGKAGFVILLLMVILFAVLLNAVASRPHGVITIALSGDQEDPLYASVRDRLMSSASMVVYSEYKSGQAAEEAVRFGECDEAWIFEKNSSRLLDEYVSGSSSSKPVTVIEMKDTVARRLAREDLSAALSSHLAERILADEYGKVTKNGAGREKLARYYSDAFYADDVFRYVNAEGIESAPGSYLTYPVRGFLAVAMLLCGLVVSMYFNRDENNMVFSPAPAAKRPVISLVYHFTGILDVGAVSLAALYICGSAVFLPLELISMLVMCLACTFTGMILGRVIRSEAVFSTVSAFIAISQLIINPVFLDVPGLTPLRVLTPVFFYIRIPDDTRYLAYLLIYTAAAGILALAAYLPDIIPRRRSLPPSH